MATINSNSILKEYVTQFNKAVGTTNDGSEAIYYVENQNISTENQMLIGQSLTCPYKGHALYWQDGKNPFLVTKDKPKGFVINIGFSEDSDGQSSFIMPMITRKFFFSLPFNTHFIFLNSDHHSVYVFGINYNVLEKQITNNADDKVANEILPTLYHLGIYTSGYGIFSSCSSISYDTSDDTSDDNNKYDTKTLINKKFDDPAYGQTTAKDIDFTYNANKEIRKRLNTTWPIVNFFQHTTEGRLIPSDVIFPSPGDMGVANFMDKWNNLFERASCSKSCPKVTKITTPLGRKVNELIKRLRTTECTNTNICISTVLIKAKDFTNTGNIINNQKLLCENESYNLKEGMDGDVITEIGVPTPYSFDLFDNGDTNTESMIDQTIIQCYNQYSQPVMVRIVEGNSIEETVETSNLHFLTDTIKIEGKPEQNIIRSRGFFYMGIDDTIYYTEPNFDNPSKPIFVVHKVGENTKYKYTMIAVKGWYETGYLVGFTSNNDVMSKTENIKEDFKIVNGQIVSSSTNTSIYKTTTTIPIESNKCGIYYKTASVSDSGCTLNNNYVEPVIPDYVCNSGDIPYKHIQGISLNECNNFTKSLGGSGFGFNNTNNDCWPKEKNSCNPIQLVKSTTKDFSYYHIN